MNVLVGKQWEIQNSGQWIVCSDQGELERAAQGTQVRPQIQATAKHLVNSGRNIRTHADPANARARCLL
jgi:hypothetical protein